MGLRILKPGLLSTIQDLGRWGYQSAGVPVSGAMDRYSMQLANMLCGNPSGSPVLECAWHGAQWLAESDLLIACCGGGSSLVINGRKVPSDRPVLVPAFSLMTLEPAPRGFYAYLAVAGGFQASKQLGSYSTYIPSRLGGIRGIALQAGELLETGADKTPLSHRMIQSLSPSPGSFSCPSWGVEAGVIDFSEQDIRVIEGPEYDWYDESTLRDFRQESFSISVQSNRMGSRLEGKKIRLREQRELLSTAVARGMIQVTHDGTLLILMADAQTTGGYPRIATVVATDLHRCAQHRPGDLLRFTRISREQAEDLYLEEQSRLGQLEMGIALRYGM